MTRNARASSPAGGDRRAGSSFRAHNQHRGPEPRRALTSLFTYNDEAVGDDPVMTFTNLRVVADAGGHHLEGVVHIGALLAAFPGDGVNLIDSGIAPAANIRPEHTLVS